MNTNNKLKIFNDPIYGFISIPNTLIFDLIAHKYFQRLRRISQMGLSYLVYPGAHHTRFHHALGCLHLMQNAVRILRFKGVEISDNEENGLYIAILLHDIGHGPFSHAMEHSIVENISHEAISLKFMEALNTEFDGKLETAISMFKGQYSRKFFGQLISGQLDIDRSDYLKRDSFYTGVSEGNINSERLISMMNVVSDELVIEEKGIYSVEKFLMARRLMYWQVYLHKTVLSAEFMLVKILQRARFLALGGIDIFASSALKKFLNNSFTLYDFKSDEKLLHLFSQLDDYDILGAIKEWCNHDDDTLRIMSNNLIHRNLLKIRLQNTPFQTEFIEELKEKAKSKLQLKHGEENYFVIADKISNHAYNNEHFGIKLLNKKGEVLDLMDVTDQLDMSHLTKVVTKHFVCFPQEIA